MFGNGNPALNKDVFAPAQSWDDLERQGRSVPGMNSSASGPSITDADIRAATPASIAASRTVMTMQGTINKSFFLLALVIAAATGTWMLLAEQRSPGMGLALTFGGMIVGLITGLVMAFWPKASPFLAPVYGIAEGAFVGGVSSFYAMQFGGKALANGKIELNTGLIANAAMLTFGITGALLALYSFRILRPGKLFYNATIVGTVGLCAYGLIALVASFIGFPSMASVYNPANGGMVSIGFSVLVLLLASANLVIDFDTINNGVKNRAEKHFEWYGAFALMSTMVWIYLEALRLLAKLSSRRE
jgi:uncharacterized YccA/Bax inhibitor family protein